MATVFFSCYSGEGWAIARHLSVRHKGNCTDTEGARHSDAGGNGLRQARAGMQGRLRHVKIDRMLLNVVFVLNDLKYNCSLKYLLANGIKFYTHKICEINMLSGMSVKIRQQTNQTTFMLYLIIQFHYNTIMFGFCKFWYRGYSDKRSLEQ